MTDLSIYFESVKLTNDSFPSGTLGKAVKFCSNWDAEELENIRLAIVGIKEERNALKNKGTSNAPDAVRQYLYNLCKSHYTVQLADLGNINPGHTVNDTYFALGNIISELVKSNIIPVIIGGSQDLTYASYLAYEKLEQTINLVTVDASFDLGDPQKDIDSKSYLNKIILHQPNFLFNYSNIGYQTYFVENEVLDLMAKLYFDVYRLGQVRAAIDEVEPIVRNADLLSFDVSAIRQADAPGNFYATPNGFYGEEACQIARYAGMSDKLSSIGFYEINPLLDNRNQTAHLTAQMIWYFIDGYYNRKKDYPIGDKAEYLKYRVGIQDNKYEIIFYKSNKSDRWWMDVPYPVSKKIRYERHHLIPCSYKDYQTACNDEMPDRWWMTYQKLC